MVLAALKTSRTAEFARVRCERTPGRVAWPAGMLPGAGAAPFSPFHAGLITRCQPNPHMNRCGAGADAHEFVSLKERIACPGAPLTRPMPTEATRKRP